MRKCVASRGPSAGSRSFPALILAATALALAGSVGVASAQTPFYPYFNKNNIHYDRFAWHIYTTDHFEIYYYPELEKHLERVASYAESAYQKVSSDLKHDLSFKVPLIILRRTASSNSRTSNRAAHRKASARSPNRTAIGCSCRSTIHRTSCSA